MLEIINTTLFADDFQIALDVYLNRYLIEHIQCIICKLEHVDL